MLAYHHELIGFLTNQDIVKLTSLTKPVIYGMIGRGEYSRPVVPSPRCVAWVEAKAKAWSAAARARSADPASRFADHGLVR
jgi:predicted DNA-binding transcriptional regulator AlpA